MSLIYSEAPFDSLFERFQNCKGKKSSHGETVVRESIKLNTQIQSTHNGIKKEFCIGHTKYILNMIFSYKVLFPVPLSLSKTNKVRLFLSVICEIRIWKMLINSNTHTNSILIFDLNKKYFRQNGRNMKILTVSNTHTSLSTLQST